MLRSVSKENFRQREQQGQKPQGEKEMAFSRNWTEASVVRLRWAGKGRRGALWMVS